MVQTAFENPDGIAVEASDRDALSAYARDRSAVTGTAPSRILYPANRAQVQAIVAEAVRSGTPLVPVSSGPPHFHGDTVPRAGGVIVDFTRMNQVLRIDPVSRSARIEPGVTFGQLIPLLRAQGLRLSLPFLPRANKSVVTSRLEREPTLIPKYQYDYLDPLLTLELVYGTGDDFRTGSACGPGTLETLKADLVNPWGPGSVDYFRLVSAAQGSMGLVTWAVTKAEVLPSLQRLYFLSSDTPAALLGTVDALLRRRTVDECVIVNRQTLATILSDTGGPGRDALRAALPRWTAMLVVAGYARRAEERIALYEQALLRCAHDTGLEGQRTLPGAAGREGELLELLGCAWTRSADWRTHHSGDNRDLIFLAPMSRMPRLLDVAATAARAAQRSLEDCCIVLQPMVQGRGCHCELNFPCASGAAADTAQCEALLSQLAPQLMSAGAFFSRPYGEWASLVYRDYPQGVAALRKLKAIFDPHNILNPGRLCFP